MSALRQRLERAFFAPSHAFNLGVCRLVFVGAIALGYLGHDVTQWARIAPDFWEPVWLVRIFGGQPSAEVLTVIGIAWKAALVLGALGLGGRVVLAIAALLGSYALGLTSSFSKLNDDIALPTILLFVFAVARSTDACSLDAWLARRRGRPPREPSAEYTWPITLGRVLLTLCFFAAGIAKLRHSGLAWVTSDNLRWLLASQPYAHAPPTDWASALSTVPWLCNVLAALVLTLELGYPLALFVPRARWLFVPGAIALQLSIHLFMGVNFLAFIAANVVWVDWARIPSIAARVRRA